MKSRIEQEPKSLANPAQREVGKRDRSALESYLRPRYRSMPRTMLRYAIEKFPHPLRQRYLTGKI